MIMTSEMITKQQPKLLKIKIKEMNYNWRPSMPDKLIKKMQMQQRENEKERGGGGVQI